jgi:hypothetical protein
MPFLFPIWLRWKMYIELNEEIAKKIEDAECEVHKVANPWH